MDRLKAKRWKNKCFANAAQKKGRMAIYRSDNVDFRGRNTIILPPSHHTFSVSFENEFMNISTYIVFLFHQGEHAIFTVLYFVSPNISPALFCITPCIFIPFFLTSL